MYLTGYSDCLTGFCEPLSPPYTVSVTDVTLACKIFVKFTYSNFLSRLSSASSFHASILHVIDVVISLALCLQVVYQAPQHCRSSKKQATCEG